MTIVGTTPDIIDAGDHTVSVSAECLGTDDAQGLTWSSDIMYQITVHAA